MHRKTQLIAGLALVLTLLSVTANARKLELVDYLDFERVSAPQISPDGKTVIYTRTKVDASKDQFNNELWVMNADGSQNRRLQASGGDVHWSPDGTRIAYIDKADTGAEIFVRWMNAEGSVSQITHQGMSPSRLSWSPDGKSIAFYASVPDQPEWNITLPPRPKGAQWTEDATVVDKLHYRVDGIGHTAGSWSHIFVVPADSGTPKQLTSGKWNTGSYMAGMNLTGPLHWTPDGSAILFSANMSLNADTEYARAGIHAVNVTSGDLATLTEGNGFWGILTGAQISPDGSKVAYMGSADATVSNFAPIEIRVSDLNGDNLNVIHDDLPGYPMYMRWASNGRGLYYIAGKEGSTNVSRVSLSGVVSDITMGAHGIYLSSVSNGGVAVGTVTSAHESGDITRFNLKDGSGMQVLTAVNEDVLGDVELGRVEEIRYDSTDNTRVQGWIVYPPDFDQSRDYPMILDIHGGPEGMYDGNFNFRYQELAAQGYLVLYTNPRGSTGYGNAFTAAIYDAYPGRVDYDDLMAGVDTVIERGFVDEERLYVQGCSGGGTLTAWVITQTDRFAGGAALCPIVNMISFAGSADIPGWAFNRYKKPFWEDPTAWLASSSIMQMNKAKTPTLVMVGKKDIRTPVGQSEEMFTALKMLGVPTKLILFNNEWHGTSRTPSNMLRTQLYLRKWYGQWRRVVRGGRPDWQSVAE